ncbi:MAG: hypothetical protein JSV16_06280 [Candidatus Hydrogenedentota bacterium]|nr:MAG: hypothetical protein JSV16_06280 [Candidatus Hydrogenedentota bacterium]
MENLREIVLDYPKRAGACAVGIASLDRLARGPPTADITFVLPEAKSAVSFAFALDQSLIPPFLGKEERERRHEILRESGCVVQNPAGSLEVVSPEEAAERVTGMSAETRALYENV